MEITERTNLVTTYLPTYLLTHGTIHTVPTTYVAAFKTTTHTKTRCRKPYAATQHLMP